MCKVDKYRCVLAKSDRYLSSQARQVTDVDLHRLSVSPARNIKKCRKIIDSKSDQNIFAWTIAWQPARNRPIFRFSLILNKKNNKTKIIKNKVKIKIKNFFLKHYNAVLL